MPIKYAVNKTLSLFGLKLSRIRSIDDESIYRDCFSTAELSEKALYNLGAGLFCHRYWTNLDHASSWYNTIYKNKNKAFIDVDFLNDGQLPISSDSASAVYCSHVIEHLPDRSVEVIFSEVYRILKPGGIFRIVVPNADLHYRAIVNQDRSYFYWQSYYATRKTSSKIGLIKPLTEASFEQLLVYELATHTSELFYDCVDNPWSDVEIAELLDSGKKPEDIFEIITSRCSIEKQSKYPGNHMNWWNRQKVFNFLQSVGFKSPNHCGYGQSSLAVLRDLKLFDSTHPKISLFVEVTK